MSRKTKKLLTHGEAWYLYKQQLNSFETKFDDVSVEKRFPKKMKRCDASKYYNNKCRIAFKSLGYQYKDKYDFEKHFKVAFKQVRAETNQMLRREIKKLKQAS